MKKVYIKVLGMTCNHCQQKIYNSLKQISYIDDVNVVLATDMVSLTYHEELLDLNQVIDKITELGYKTDLNMAFESEQEFTNVRKNQIINIINTFLIIIILYLLVKKFIGFDFLNVIPNINNSISYPLLFIIGLMTSIHCVGMCGSFNLAASVGIKLKNPYTKPLLYNLGRVISYTLLGGLAGLIGRVLTPSNFLQGILVGLAAIFMLIMGFSMLGLMSKKILSLLPKHKPRKIKTSSPFIIGLLNGFMPCGPLQAMQLYAISTASFFLGAFSMLLFALGTVPLMLLVGILFNSLKGKKVFAMQRISAVLVILLAFTMFSRSLGYLGVSGFNNSSKYQTAEIRDNYQYVEIEVKRNAYETIIIQNNIPVQFNLIAKEGSLNGCNNPIMINSFNIKEKMIIGNNIINFTPTKTGTYVYTCWMSMIRSQIIVVENIDESEYK